MLRGIFALFFRSLRGDSRSLWVHLTWFCLLAVIYVSMWVAQAQSELFGAPGLHFFQSVIYANAVFLTLLGISYFSSAISEEKEEGTLGLMTMAGISHLGILLGKSTTRLYQVFLLLALQYPFTLLAVTLGGLMPDQIYSAYAALLAYTILLANVGLFCSVLCRRNRDAAALTTLWMVGYIFVPLFALGGYHYLINGPGTSDPFWIVFSPTVVPVLSWISETNVFGALAAATETGHQFSLTPQLVSNSIGGVLFFLLSWSLIGLVSHDPAPEGMRIFVARSGSRMRLFSAGRVWGEALAWKDFHFITGGRFGILMRCGLYLGLYGLAFAANYPWYDPMQNIRLNDVTWGYQFFVVPLFTLDCALAASRLFNEEIRHQTLASLLMLPRTVPQIVYAKMAGCLIGLIPGMIALVAAFFLLPEDWNRKSISELVKLPMAWWFAANLFLVIHLSGLFSLFLRWGAFALALGLTVGSMILTGFLVEMVMLSGGGVSGRDVETMLGFMTIPLLLVCAGCHVITILRLPALGEK